MEALLELQRKLRAYFREDFQAYRDELIISSKAGYHMWKVHTENGALVNLSFQVVIRVSKEWG